MTDDPRNPLDYHSPPNSSLDPDINSLWWVRFARRGRRQGCGLRVVYYVVMLSAIAVALWYVWKMLISYDGLAK